MKRFSILYILMLVCLTVVAQPSREDMTPQRDANFITGNRAYEIIVQRVDSASEVSKRNRAVTKGMKTLREQSREQSRGNIGGLLVSALQTGYSSLLSQTAVNLTSNLVNYTAEYITTAIKNHKERFNNWLKKAQSYRTFSKTLSQQHMIEDFYALPSNNGAFDPENIAFKGIGCRSYFSSQGQDRIRQSHDDYCYIFCSLRTDTVGTKSIVNHSKFLLEIDSIYFRPNLCDIPNKQPRTVSRNSDFFQKHSDLSVTLNAKVYSSWFNEAIMLQRDQLLGSFDVVMKIDSSDCVKENGEWVFRYTKADSLKYKPLTDKNVRREHLSEVSISGESFIVPRSYSMNYGSSDYQPIWGTGEYRVELTLSENSDLNKNYYCRKTESSSNPHGKEKVYYDKEIWLKEWAEMKSDKGQATDGSDKSENYLNGVWENVYSTVKGSSWITTFLSPLVNAVTDTESKAINQGLGITSGSTGIQNNSAAQTKQSPNATSVQNTTSTQTVQGQPTDQPSSGDMPMPSK